MDSNRFFLGKVNRENATKILLSGGPARPRDGHFLIRESLRSPGYVLSVLCKGQVYHFQIASREDGLLRIDDGPLFTNLELVVVHYRVKADGLPCPLTTAAPGGIPPPAVESPRQGLEFNGPSLHQASSDGNVQTVLRYLNERPQDVNCRDMHMSTPLLEAVRNGHESVVKILLSHRADPTLKDGSGHIPLKVSFFVGTCTCTISP